MFAIETWWAVNRDTLGEQYIDLESDLFGALVMVRINTSVIVIHFSVTF